MPGTNKAKEMKASRTHRARRAALMVKTETQMAPVEAGKGKRKVGSKGFVKARKQAIRRRDKAVKGFCISHVIC